jgi:hypothetical protein
MLVRSDDSSGTTWNCETTGTETEHIMAGSITQEDRDFVETWEHISPQQYGIMRLDPRGDERHEVIAGRRNFKITTEERILSQDKIKYPEMDPFLNGAFRPIVVPDSVTIETNPNALSDEEINKILASSELAWNEWLGTIDSVATIRRMMELAESSDISIKRFRSLEQRLIEVRGRVRIDTKDPALQRFLSNAPGGGDAGGGGGDGGIVSSGAQNPRRQGGRSSDYR